MPSKLTAEEVTAAAGGGELKEVEDWSAAGTHDLVAVSNVSPIL